MAHFKRAPIRACFYLSGPDMIAPTRSSTWPPSICAMSCVCWSVFLDFDDVTEQRWPVCCDYENCNMNLLDFALFANSQRNSADQLDRRGAWSFLRFCWAYWKKISWKMGMAWSVTRSPQLVCNLINVIRNIISLLHNIKLIFWKHLKMCTLRRPALDWTESLITFLVPSKCY